MVKYNFSNVIFTCFSVCWSGIQAELQIRSSRVVMKKSGVGKITRLVFRYTGGRK